MSFRILLLFRSFSKFVSSSQVSLNPIYSIPFFCLFFASSSSSSSSSFNSCEEKKISLEEDQNKILKITPLKKHNKRVTSNPPSFFLFRIPTLFFVVVFLHILITRARFEVARSIADNTTRLLFFVALPRTTTTNTNGFSPVHVRVSRRQEQRLFEGVLVISQENVVEKGLDHDARDGIHGRREDRHQEDERWHQTSRG